MEKKETETSRKAEPSAAATHETETERETRGLPESSQLKVKKVIWFWSRSFFFAFAQPEQIYDLTCCNESDHDQIRGDVEIHLKFHFSDDQLFYIRR